MTVAINGTVQTSGQPLNPVPALALLDHFGSVVSAENTAQVSAAVATVNVDLQGQPSQQFANGLVSFGSAQPPNTQPVGSCCESAIGTRSLIFCFGGLLVWLFICFDLV